MTNPPPKPATKTRDQKKAETRAAILDAAVDVFTKDSVTTTPVEAIARAAGVSKATMFFHFGSRIELLEAVANMIYDYGVHHIWEAQRAGVLPFLREYLASQRTPATRVVWEIGDVLSANGRPGPDIAYLHLIDEIQSRLAKDSIEATMRPALARLIAASGLHVARRTVFGEADDDELRRFLTDVETVLEPWRTDRDP